MKTDYEICPSARKRNVMNGGKLVGVEHECKTTCILCHGTAKVVNCPDCTGFGLRVGGVRCITCQCTGKRPAYTVPKEERVSA